MLSPPLFFFTLKPRLKLNLFFLSFSYFFHFFEFEFAEPFSHFLLSFLLHFAIVSFNPIGWQRRFSLRVLGRIFLLSWRARFLYFEYFALFLEPFINFLLAQLLTFFFFLFKLRQNRQFHNPHLQNLILLLLLPHIKRLSLSLPFLVHILVTFSFHLSLNLGCLRLHLQHLQLLLLLRPPPRLLQLLLLLLLFLLDFHPPVEALSGARVGGSTPRNVFRLLYESELLVFVLLVPEGVGLFVGLLDGCAELYVVFHAGEAEGGFAGGLLAEVSH